MEKSTNIKYQISKLLAEKQEQQAASLAAVKLLAASSSEDQSVEGAKTIELAHLRLEAVNSELLVISRESYVRTKRPRLAEVSLTDLRIPLVWKDTR